jgi:hypothetical protein
MSVAVATSHSRAAVTVGPMEVVLLWLDDLDDVVFSAALLWGRLRRVLLQIGLAAALALAGCESWPSGERWAVPLSAVAAASVAAWLLGAAFRLCYYREPRLAIGDA